MFYPTFENFLIQHYRTILQRLRILLFLDIDGVLRIRKGPVPRDIVRILHDLSMQHWVRIIPITGAPARQLPKEILWPNLPLHRAFAESGGVEQLADGTLIPEGRFARDLQNLIARLGIVPENGLLHIPALAKTIICEGERHTSFTAILGSSYGPYPKDVPTAGHEEVRAWIAGVVTDHNLPFVLLSGYEQTYSYIDVVHQRVGKAWRVGHVIGETPHDLAFYIGDGTGDEEAMARLDIIPVALANSTARIKRQGKERGFMIEKEGPDGTYEFLTGLMDFLQQTR